MARRYDSRTTIFSPEGRLYQVEYAMEAISHAGSAVGIQTTGGVILAAEKKVSSKLLEPSFVSPTAPSKTEKMFKIDNHLACAVAGITADANILIGESRLASQRYTYQYGEPVPVEQLVQQVCDIKQGYTQFGGLRPFGVAFLIAGWDEHLGYQLYHSDPSGNYGGWKATAIGANNQSAQSILKQEYTEEISLQDGLKLAMKVLSKTMDSSSLNAEKLEFSTLTIKNGSPSFHPFTPTEIDELVASCDLKTNEEAE
eukprot:TRINITY_DN6738_c0_g1_i1.p2 TRINITY_DN6738_c0_g1~~TRINITY_DN6738_c0_g1_i1.p2  ORF type:complete len:256 (-),score=114.92 TRINITY_DN6738_c0_g1_i1:147-914(-)